MNHAHLTDDIKKIEYIECATAGDMAWKEIYYINLFANKYTTNTSELYTDGVTDLRLNDQWKLYTKRVRTYIVDETRIKENQTLITNKDLTSRIPLIHILENEKLNNIGRNKYGLSRKWFYDDNYQQDVIQLKRHMYNYFHNICQSKSSECLWTTYDEVAPLIADKGFKKGFISLNNNNVMDRKYLAFACNLFYPSGDKFLISENNYALSEMFQFIWRSAIRDGNEIWVYIPSIRMRTLLQQWIKQNSPQTTTK